MRTCAFTVYGKKSRDLESFSKSSGEKKSPAMILVDMSRLMRDTPGDCPDSKMLIARCSGLLKPDTELRR